MSEIFTSALCTAVLLGAAFLSSPMQARAASKESDSQALQLLDDAGAQAANLNMRADELESLVKNDQVTWQIHADKLNLMRNDINRLASTLDKLMNMQSNTASWQQEAVARIVPLEAQVASDTTKTIEYLNEHPTRIIDQPYQQDVQSSAEAARQLSAAVKEYVDYGKDKANVDKDKTNMERIDHELGSPS